MTLGRIPDLGSFQVGMVNDYDSLGMVGFGFGRNHPTTAKLGRTRISWKHRMHKKKSMKWLGFPSGTHQNHFWSVRGPVISSILQPAHRAIVHGKATGDPVELLMKCLKFKKFMALWNVWRIWRILGCLFCLGVCACLIWLAVISQSGSWYYTPEETPVTTHCSWCWTQRCFHHWFSKVLFRLANCVSAGGCCHVPCVEIVSRGPWDGCFISMTSNQTASKWNLTVAPFFGGVTTCSQY